MIDNKNKRCIICDYCHVSSPFEPIRTFSRVHNTNPSRDCKDYICHECKGSISEAMEDFVEDELLLALEIPLEAPTLAVHGDPGGDSYLYSQDKEKANADVPD